MPCDEELGADAAGVRAVAVQDKKGAVSSSVDRSESFLIDGLISFSVIPARRSFSPVVKAVSFHFTEENRVVRVAEHFRHLPHV